MSASEESIATLVYPDEYRKHLGEVASVTTEHIRVVQRKLLSRVGWELVDIPFTDCTAITYRDERAWLKMLLGVLITGLTAVLCYMLYIYWDSLNPGTRVPIGAIALMGLVGIRWAFDSRRHRLIFSLTDGRAVRWKSRLGDYKYKMVSTRNVVTFARESGRLSPESSNYSMQPTAGSGG